MSISEVPVAPVSHTFSGVYVSEVCECTCRSMLISQHDNHFSCLQACTYVSMYVYVYAGMHVCSMYVCMYVCRLYVAPGHSLLEEGRCGRKLQVNGDFSPALNPNPLPSRLEYVCFNGSGGLGWVSRVMSLQKLQTLEIQEKINTHKQNNRKPKTTTNSTGGSGRYVTVRCL